MKIKELDQAFEKLLFNLAVATYYYPYKEGHDEYKEMLEIIAGQKIEYDQTRESIRLSENLLEDVHHRSLPLLEKYVIEDGNYAEQFEIWSDYLLNLYKRLLIKEK